MTSTPAFALGAPLSSFSNSTVYSSSFSLCPRPVLSKSIAPSLRNGRSLIVSQMQFNEPQPGDAGYKPPPPVPKGTGMSKTETPKPASSEASTPAPAAGGKKLPVSGGGAGFAKRGLDLLKEDLLKNAPTRAGVGRQDQSAIMKPMYGEPGYKPAAYETVKVSELGISPFPDDANAVGNVGGIEAVKKAAVEVTKGGKTAAEIKKKVLKIESKSDEQEVFDIPDYLKPLPEDTPRKGFTWKNYNGR